MESNRQRIPGVCNDARNLRFALSTDGISPFGEQNSSHITWPVTLSIYNLPPWLCVKQKFIIMPVVIQGPKQPGNDIDVYLRPLIDELLILWNKGGVRVWDEYKQEHFDLRALLFIKSMIGLLLVIFQDSQTRDIMHAHTVFMI